MTALRALAVWCLALLSLPATHGAVIGITNRADLQFGAGPGQTNFYTSAPVSVLVDLDPPQVPTTGLFIEKIVSRQTAEIGDFVDYTIRVRNVASNSLAAVIINDLLPAGFAYVSGTTRINGTTTRDPAGRGPRLQFTAGPISANDSISISYRVRIGPGASEGEALNSAQAQSSDPSHVLSNVAQAGVLVGGGVFTDRAIIFGKVYVDANTNRVQDPKEPGVPGIRLYLEDGTYVITDGEGKYNFYGLRPLTHVLKLDKTTLPPKAKLEVLSNRYADDGSLQMIELRASEFHKADFALSPGPAAMMEEIRRRKALAEQPETEANMMLKSRLTPDGVPLSRGDPKGLPASGIVGGAINAGPSASTLTPVKPQVDPVSSPKGDLLRTNSTLYQPLLPEAMLNSDNSALPTAPIGDAAFPGLEPGLTNLDNALGFVDLKNGDTLPMAQATIRTKGVIGGTITLWVNEKEVAVDRIGRRLVISRRKMEVTEFVGVALRPGTNHLEIKEMDGFGNRRGTNSIAVIAPDKLGRIRLVLPAQEPSADGRTPVTITVKLEDAQGVPVTTRTPLTLEASLGEWQVVDLNKTEPGTQVFIEGGTAQFRLLPPREPGDCHLRVSTGIINSEAVFPFLPDLRPLIAAGVLEGRLSLNSLNASSIVPTRSRDGFDEELRSFAVSNGKGTVTGAGRAAFFLKGKIKGEYLLTAGFDSEKDTHERLFRDIQPDEFYPVYGDSAVKGYDAQSTSRLYVRIDKRKCYLLYGDFISTSQSEARALGNYSRSLTGIREHYEKNWISANLWGSYNTSSQVIEEVPAEGISGPYSFHPANAVVNSEKVEIITRDRNQPALVLGTIPMSRFSDYEFEPFTGRLLFKAPVSSRDANLNPVFIRITYENDKGGDKFWVYGGDAQVKVSPWLEVGGSAVRDENPQGHYGLQSVNTTVALTPKTFIIGELAQTETVNTDGSAGRIELRHQDDRTDGRIYYGRAGNTFSNSASIIAPGRTEGGGKVAYKLTSDTRLTGQALFTESLGNHGDRKGVRVDIERTFPNQVRLELGARYSDETTAPASATTVGATPNQVTSLRMKATTPVPGVKGTSVYAEYENDVIEPEKRLVAIGGDYQIRPKTRLYARHEFIDTLGGPFELNTFQQQNITLVGLDTAYMKDGTLFNEYRMRDAISGREAEAATGLRNLWNLSEGLRLNTTFERISPVVGSVQNEATAVTGAIEYTGNPDWKGSARLELRTSDPNDSLLNTLGYARKLNQDWTFLGRTIVYLVNNKAPGVGDRDQTRIQGGFAWRQTQISRWNALAKYELKIEGDESVPGASLHRQVHMLLGDLNFQPSADWTMSGHYAGKLAFEDSNGLDTTTDGHLFGLQVTYDLSRRWDIGLGGRVLFSTRNPSAQFGIGPEVGFRVRDNVRIACGYNVIGFRDRDLSTEQNTSHGFYVALRLMFDESLFGLRKEGTK